MPVPVAHVLRGGYSTGTATTMPSGAVNARARRGHDRRRGASSRASFQINPSVEEAGEAESEDFGTQREEVLRSLINARRPGYMGNA